jgi:hypothetical protein
MTFSSFLPGMLVIGFKAHLNDLISRLTSLHMQRSFYRISSHLQVLRGRA